MSAESEKYRDITWALEQAEKKGIKVTRATMIIWVDKNKLGFQPGGEGGAWQVNCEKFTLFLEGKLNDGQNNT